jgi:hypothetical protein
MNGVLRAALCGLAFVTSVSVAGKAGAAERLATIWFRSSEACPDGASFLQKIAQRSTSARLAAVGDHIDFVVTLGSVEGGASGRLERQTERGTVAIRDIRAPNCEAVAEALALTLSLTIDPQAAAPQSEPPAQPRRLASESVAPAVESVPRPEPTAMAATTLSESERRSPSLPVARGEPVSSSAAIVRAGLGGSFAYLNAGHERLGAGAFVDLQASERVLAFRPALRLSAQASMATDADTDLRILAGRFDLCPATIAFGGVEARPCAAAELGQITAQREVRGGARDSALWSALLGEVRLLWPASRRWAFELELGVSIPLTRYDFTLKGGDDVGRTGEVAVIAGIGGSFRLQ